MLKLKIGDRVRHGRNFGTVTKQTDRGPEITWDHGLIDFHYDEEMYKAHPLHLAFRKRDLFKGRGG